MGGGRGVVVRSDSPRPLRRQHRGGSSGLMSSKTSGRLQQRDDAAGGEEGRTLRPGGTDGVSCVGGGRQLVFSSASGLSDRLIGDMKHGLGSSGCVLRPPPGEENFSRRNPGV